MQVQKFIPFAFFILLGLIFLTACEKPEESYTPSTLREGPPIVDKGPFITILGIAQDAGYPQTACEKDCCVPAWHDKSLRAHPTSLGLVNPETRQKWVFEASPDFSQQLSDLNDIQKSPLGHLPDGIFLTHAHMGHYTGLMHLGREAVGAKGVPVYAMPRMASFLQENGPWSQLVALNNIQLFPLTAESGIGLTVTLSVTPFLVPHRDEFSETVGYKIQGPNKTVLFIPDIDKWNKWGKSLSEEIEKVDLALVDGTFFANGELPGRDMSEIPHPFVEETMAIMENLPLNERSKIIFIHFNHTNPLLQKNSEAYKSVVAKGYQIAFEGQKIPL